MADKVKVTLVKSTIGAVPKNKKTIEALGLTKMYKTVELPNNAATAGALRKVAPYVSFPGRSDSGRNLAGPLFKISECFLRAAFSCGT